MLDFSTRHVELVTRPGMIEAAWECLLQNPLKTKFLGRHFVTRRKEDHWSCPLHADGPEGTLVVLDHENIYLVYPAAQLRHAGQKIVVAEDPKERTEDKRLRMHFVQSSPFTRYLELFYDNRYGIIELHFRAPAFIAPIAEKTRKHPYFTPFDYYVAYDRTLPAPEKDKEPKPLIKEDYNVFLANGKAWRNTVTEASSSTLSSKLMTLLF